MQCVDVKYIIKTVKSSRIYLWIWNTIGESHKKEITYYKRKGITLCTFDKMDAQQYDIILLNQVFRDLPDKNFMGKYDFFFIGKDKGRYQFLEWIAGALVQKKYCVKFLLLADKDVDYPTQYLSLIHIFMCVILFTKSLVPLLKRYSGISKRMRYKLPVNEMCIRDSHGTSELVHNVHHQEVFVLPIHYIIIVWPVHKKSCL